MVKKPIIAIGGSAGNPSHLGHRKMAQALIESNLFDEIYWILRGESPDKRSLAAPNHRINMARLTFPSEWALKGFLLDFRDVWQKNTPTIEWVGKMQKAYPDSHIMCYSSVDVLVPQDQWSGKCEVEARWVAGPRLLKECDWVVLPRAGYPHPRELSLGSNFLTLEADLPEISSSQIRTLRAEGKPFEHLVTDGVGEYIKLYQLYTKLLETNNEATD